MPIIGTIASSRRSAVTIEGSMEPIAVATVPSGGLSSITFGNIPQTYKHLQIRGMHLLNGVTDVLMTFNTDTNSSNYRFHIMRSFGTATPVAESYTGPTLVNGQNERWTPTVVDIVDYTSATKTKVTKVLTGTAFSNANAEVGLWSHFWYGTPAAINSITISTLNSAILMSQNTRFALYGIKGD